MMGLTPHQNFVNRKMLWWVFPLTAALLLAIAGCDMLSPTAAAPPTPAPTLTPTVMPLPPPTPTAIVVAEITFQATIPEDTPPDEPIQLSILDEVTGLTLNPAHYTMQAISERTYAVKVQVVNGTMIKYRYSRQGTLTAEEHSADGRPVRYRLYHVNGSGQVNDLVARWNDTQYSGPTGRIMGTVVDARTNEPIPNIMIAAGGVQVLTAWDGSFLMEGLPPNNHLLVAYALDGMYRTYQQGAVIADQSTTPVSLYLEPVPTVSVTFKAKVPGDTFPGVPLRLAGNLYQLGNTFANLSGGVSVPAYRMPVMQHIGEGEYTLTLDLPVGADVRYKYTLGDGFWNAEHDNSGRYVTRQIVIPPRDITLDNVIAGWRSGKSAPVWFDVTTPANTPPGDMISIQFNPYGWTQPIPMWKLDQNRWVYMLSSPMDILGRVTYRYCRNYQCGSADDIQTTGTNPNGRIFSTSLIFQQLHDEVSAWQWINRVEGSISVPGDPVIAEREGFVAGVEILPYYHPSLKTWMPATHADIRLMGANWVFHTPTWSYTSQNPPVLEAISGVDIPWLDQLDAVTQAAQNGLNVALYPQIHRPVDLEAWWQEAERDQVWWKTWFERYQVFILHHAGMAERLNVPLLILGGEWLTPAMPNGHMDDGFSSNVPANAEARWRDILTAVRQVYQGEIAWALPYPQGIQNPPPFLDSVDVLYILWEIPLSDQYNPDSQQIYTQVSSELDVQLMPFASQFHGRVILAPAYASATGAANGCISSAGDGCTPPQLLARPNDDIPDVSVNLWEQVNIYNGLLLSIAERDFIDGVVVRGYYSPAALQDKSTSVHGKPAEQVIRYWFTTILDR